MSQPPFPGDTYITPPGSATFFASRFPSLSFYWKVANIIRRDGNLAAAGLYDAEAWSRGSLDTLRALEDCGITVQTEGMDNIDKVDGPCVFIGNHMSTLETFVLPIFIQPRKNVTFVVKESLIGYPWFGAVLKSRDPIVVGRVNPRQDLTAVLEGGEKRLKKGFSIIVFPQSTRSTTLDPNLFNTIGVKLARRAGVPVIPMALRTNAWGIGSLIKDAGPITPAFPVHFAFGEPMQVTGAGKEEHTAICRFITERLDRWNLPVAV